MDVAFNGIPTPAPVTMVLAQASPTLNVACTQVNGQVVCQSLAPTSTMFFHETNHTMVSMSSMESTLILGAAILGFLATTLFCMFANKISVAYAERRYPMPSLVRREVDPATQEANISIVKSMTIEERRCYVTKCLKTHVFEELNSTDASATVTTLRRAFSLKSLCADSSPTCAICLDSFDGGDTICSSQNSMCPHQFHLECAFEWLLKSQECPCCRRDYLTIKTPELDGDNDIEKGMIGDDGQAPSVETEPPMLVQATTQ